MPVTNGDVDERTREDLLRDLSAAEQRADFLRVERDRYQKRSAVLLDLLYEARGS